ncbi:hypothetical protein [Neisseria weixii]
MPSQRFQTAFEFEAQRTRPCFGAHALHAESAIVEPAVECAAQPRTRLFI